MHVTLSPILIGTDDRGFAVRHKATEQSSKVNRPDNTASNQSRSQSVAMGGFRKSFCTLWLG